MIWIASQIESIFRLSLHSFHFCFVCGYFGRMFNTQCAYNCLLINRFHLRHNFQQKNECYCFGYERWAQFLRHDSTFNGCHPIKIIDGTNVWMELFVQLWDSMNSQSINNNVKRARCLIQPTAQEKTVELTITLVSFFVNRLFKVVEICSLTSPSNLIG